MILQNPWYFRTSTLPDICANAGCCVSFDFQSLSPLTLYHLSALFLSTKCGSPLLSTLLRAHVASLTMAFLSPQPVANTFRRQQPFWGPRIPRALSHHASPPTHVSVPSLVAPTGTTLRVSPVSSKRVVPVVGVASTCIHDVASRRRVSPRFHSFIGNLHGTNGELVMAIRLVPSVILGALIGMDRHALRYGLTVCTVTLLSATASLVTVVAVAACVPGIAWTTLVVLIGALCSAGGMAFLASLFDVEHSSGMGAAVAGIAAALGTACGAGLPFVALACYLLAIVLLRIDDISHRKDASSSHRNFGAHTMQLSSCISGPAKWFGLNSKSTINPTRVFVSRTRRHSRSRMRDQEYSAYSEVAHGDGATLRYATKNTSGTSRVVEVTGSSLEDAIEELRRREQTF